MLALPAVAIGQPVTERVSVSSRGVQGNSYSFEPLVSDGGRYAVFVSEASNLVRHDRNRAPDIFRRDRFKGTTRRLVWSVPSYLGVPNPFYFDAPLLGFIDSGRSSYRYLLRDLRTRVDVQLNLDSRGRPVQMTPDAGVDVSAGGRYFAFANTDRVVPGDENGQSDVFVRDVQAATTTRASLGTGGAEGNGPSSGPAVSADGRFVAFVSDASNLVPGDTDGVKDVFLRDRVAGTTSRMSLGTNGAQANAGSDGASISADGRLVAFSSDATNLVSGDSNGTTDVFVRDRQTGITTRISVSSSGKQANGLSWGAKFIGPRLVRFGTAATNLVGGAGGYLVHDVSTGRTSRAAPSPPPSATSESSYPITFSPDGRWIAFSSESSELVRRDTNRRQDAFVHGPLATPFTLPDGMG